MLGIEERLNRRIGRSSRVESMSIRFTKDEQSALVALAKAEGKTVREWAREALLQQLRGHDADAALLTEVVALRMLTSTVLRSVALGHTLTPEAYAQILAEVRNTKHDAARDVLSQYQKQGKGRQL